VKPSGPPSSRYRSPQYGTTLGILTDSAIERYIRAGRYGEAARQALAEREARARKASTIRQPGKRSPTLSALDALRASGLDLDNL
jgi:phage baseplate assembly protein W